MQHSTDLTANRADRGEKGGWQSMVPSAMFQVPIMNARAVSPPFVQILVERNNLERVDMLSKLERYMHLIEALFCPLFPPHVKYE